MDNSRFGMANAIRGSHIVLSSVCMSLSTTKCLNLAFPMRADAQTQGGKERQRASCSRTAF